MNRAEFAQQSTPTFLFDGSRLRQRELESRSLSKIQDNETPRTSAPRVAKIKVVGMAKQRQTFRKTIKIINLLPTRLGGGGAAFVRLAVTERSFSARRRGEWLDVGAEVSDVKAMLTGHPFQDGEFERLELQHRAPLCPIAGNWRTIAPTLS
jgi:hypothetical protein